MTSSVWSTGCVCRVGGAKWEDTKVWEEVMLEVMEVVVPASGTEVPSLAVGTKESDLALQEGAASLWRGGGRNPAENHNQTHKLRYVTSCFASRSCPHRRRLPGRDEVGELRGVEVRQPHRGPLQQRALLPQGGGAAPARQSAGAACGRWRGGRPVAEEEGGNALLQSGQGHLGILDEEERRGAGGGPLLLLLATPFTCVGEGGCRSRY